MDAYFKCTCCGGFDSMSKAHYNNEQDQDNEENAICTNCLEKRLDNHAENESRGEFRNYGDWMESKGVTVCDSHYVSEREC